jgi:copper chaperone NosL
MNNHLTIATAMRAGTSTVPAGVTVRTRFAVLLFAASLMIAAGCSHEPKAIAYDKDTCENCGMTISNNRYGAALVTTNGRTHKFDSVDCMVESQMPGQSFADAKVAAQYVVTYEFPGELRDATSAIYLVSEDMTGPMGSQITAFANQQDAEHVQHIKTGDLLDWPAVNAYVHGPHHP